MSRIRREYETPVLLAMACALLALGVLGEWGVKTLSHRSVRAGIDLQARTGSESATDQAGHASFALAEVERFGDLVERPLFFQGRRAPVQTEAPKMDKPFDVQLHGVVAEPDSAFALLKEKDGAYHRLREKETLLGWRLTQIRPDRVELQRGDDKMELLLQKPKPKGSGVAKPGGQGSGAPDKPRKIDPIHKSEKTENE